MSTVSAVRGWSPGLWISRRSLSSKHLVVAALGNNTLEVVDLSSLSVAAFIAESNKLYVANGGNGKCDVYDGSTYALLKRLDLGGDADNMHYAAAGRQLVVSAGNGLRSSHGSNCLATPRALRWSRTNRGYSRMSRSPLRRGPERLSALLTIETPRPGTIRKWHARQIPTYGTCSLSRIL